MEAMRDDEKYHLLLEESSDPISPEHDGATAF
jgi:hypothetical protein